MNTKDPAICSPEFLAVFRSQAGAAGVMGFDGFMRLALYHPEVGYYRKPEERIGYAQGTDFFTASTSGPVFGELIAAACSKLLSAELASRAVFVEIGNERPGGILAGVAHPFAEARTVSLGEPITLPEFCIVFSNELFDAQPFRRFRYRSGRWRELGVALAGSSLVEREIDTVIPAVLPAATVEGYVIDAPLAAVELVTELASPHWHGLFLAFDYGKSWRELVEACPAGTARAYHRHQQSNALLARPGQQDLTCHVCWDWLAETLAVHGFAAPVVESQEGFLIRHASEVIASIATQDAAHYSRRKQSLQQLIQPAHLGRKFQALRATRL